MLLLDNVSCCDCLHHDEVSRLTLRAITAQISFVLRTAQNAFVGMLFLFTSDKVNNY